ncbi:hypothetical protein [Anaeromyxobacter oryzae]|uniref:Lipoprotein n=1 Tax=Anaeromyxobacter oryzae TaxID=2918170 RepID=A0ABN6N1D9_9BACT|nr:hypothetical protein [Anaeromyxobacter oryzae]BDG05729.1 hypothetical protein AMOR_47250 [Anaeromyxobacter oryzae]
MRRAIALLCGLCACSGLRTYPTVPGGNLSVRPRLEAGVTAALHVHRLDAQCRVEYLGTVKLDDAQLTLDLPAGQASYLLVTFDTSSFFAGRRNTSAAALLNPRAGWRYELDVRYREDIYDVALSEADPHTGQRRVLARRDLDACRPGR